jgi:hypothetical protein
VFARGSRDAWASGPAEVKADEIILDAKGQGRSLEAHGNVRVDAYPFFLTADRLKLERSWRGLEVEGPARLSFCPCAGPPFLIEFDSGAVAPPGDLIVKNPKLLFFGVPVFWLPYFWLRAPSRVGILPPVLAFRGSDGVFSGGGIFLPIGKGLALNGGGYWKGGYAVTSSLRGERYAAEVKLESLRGDAGLVVDTRGSTEPEVQSQASFSSFNWDVDARVFARALTATTDFDAAVKPVDRAEAQALHWGAAGAVSSSVRAVSPRGNRLERSGTVLMPGISAAAHYDLSARVREVFAFDAFAIRDGEALRKLARARVSSDAQTSLGAVGFRAQLQGTMVAGSRLRFTTRSSVQASVPFARSFADGTRHLLDPGLHLDGFGQLGPDRMAGEDVAMSRQSDALPQGTGPRIGSLGVLSANLRSVLGNAEFQWEASGSAGIAVQAHTRAPSRVVARVKNELRMRAFALSLDAAAVSESNALSLLAKARLGTLQGAHLRLGTLGRTAADPTLARVLSEDEGPLPFASQAGWSLFAGAALPVTRWFRFSASADGDLSARELLGIRGALEFRDRCDCIAFRIHASERIGRPGVDGWVEIDFHPPK